MKRQTKKKPTICNHHPRPQRARTCPACLARIERNRRALYGECWLHGPIGGGKHIRRLLKEAGGRGGGHALTSYGLARLTWRHDGLLTIEIDGWTITARP